MYCSAAESSSNQSFSEFGGSWEGVSDGFKVHINQ